MMKKENPTLEYKGEASGSYLKTVSAFANYGSGKIIFGINDDHSISPIKDVKSFCESIESQINDSMKPVPKFSLTAQEDGTIILFVEQGENTPYLYHGKAYRRNDSSTVQVNDYELKRLILAGNHLNFEETPSRNQNLTFHYLANQFQEKLHLSEFNTDTLKTLQLFSDKDGYNVAAALLSDKNDFYGLDVVVFGEDENTFKERINLSGESVLKQYDDVAAIFERNYIYEKIVDTTRKRIEKIPSEAFREAIANALIRRTWDVRVNTKVGFYPDKIEITSPGGLPSNLSKEQYLEGNFSSLRNPILADIFHRLNIVEIFATGIKRIIRSYEQSYSKPEFRVFDTSVTIVLPVVESNVILTNPEANLLQRMNSNVAYSRLELENATHLNKATLLRLLNSLIKKGSILKEGESSATTYRKIK